MLIQVGADLNTLKEANRPPRVLSAFLILEGQSKFVFVVIGPCDYGVTLSTKLV